MSDQLPLDGIPPAALPRHPAPKATHLPTRKDVADLREWIATRTTSHPKRPMAHRDVPLRFIVPEAEVEDLLALADRWEAMIDAREGVA